MFGRRFSRQLTVLEPPKGRSAHSYRDSAWGRGEYYGGGIGEPRTGIMCVCIYIYIENMHVCMYVHTYTLYTLYTL